MRARVAQQALGLVQRVVPRDFLEPRAPYERLAHAILRVQMREREPPLVAEPALVDLGVIAREDALHLPFARRRGDVAAHRAHAADRRHVLDLPRPRLEAVLRRRECADGTELDHVAGERPAVRLVLERRDHRL